MKTTVRQVLSGIMKFCWMIWIPVIISSYGCSADRTPSAGLHVFDIHTPGELRSLLQYTPGNAPLLMAHRGGARKDFPENCIQTFTNTLRHTRAMMEVDPRYTRDSVIVLFHDDTLERTSTGQGKVSEHTFEELTKLKLKDTEGAVTPCQIPTLDEALEWSKGKTILFLDNKDVPVEERVKKIQEHQAEAHAVVMAYSFEDARRIHELDPDIMMQVFMPDREAAARFEEAGIPWENVVAFITHKQPDDEHRAVLQLINEKGARAVIGTSRTIDRAYAAGAINRSEMEERYRKLVRFGADIIEADLAVEAGASIQSIQSGKSPKQQR